MLAHNAMMRLVACTVDSAASVEPPNSRLNAPRSARFHGGYGQDRDCVCADLRRRVNSKNLEIRPRLLLSKNLNVLAPKVVAIEASQSASFNDRSPVRTARRKPVLARTGHADRVPFLTYQRPSRRSRFEERAARCLAFIAQEQANIGSAASRMQPDRAYPLWPLHRT
jgi:hypothetical protein